MDTSTLISLAALIVSILALPTSYFVAVRQVKVGLDEFERRSKLKARLLVADRLDEFFKAFFSAVQEFTGIGQNELRDRPKEAYPHIEQHIQEIDNFMSKTGVLDRLALAIDDLAATGYAGMPQSSDPVTKLQSIRAHLALGSDAAHSVTLGVISNLGRGDHLQSALRDT